MRPSRHGNVLRAHVGFMLAFYALALCRGVIPGLCATLADEAGVPALVKIAGGCCSQSSDSSPVTSTTTHCAFCSLLTTVSHAVDSPVVPRTVFVDQPGRLDGQTAPNIAALHDPILRRGPPALV